MYISCLWLSVRWGVPGFEQTENMKTLNSKLSQKLHFAQPKTNEQYYERQLMGIILVAYVAEIYLGEEGCVLFP